MMGQDTDSSRASTITLILAFIIAGMFFIMDRGSDRLLSQTTKGAEAGFAPALELLSRPLRAIENIVIGFQDRSRAVEENIALREELYDLREEKQRYQLMEKKLAHLEKILGIEDGIDIPTKKVVARAISEVEGPFVRSALINVGVNKGVKKGHPVMTVHGLYGHILHSGPISSRVLQLGDLNSRISVMSERSEARAILSGDNSDLPLLAFVEDRADWGVGDTVLSSGDGGVLPQGLPVGEVRSNDSGQFVVELGTTGKPIDWVWVYPYQATQAPQESDNAENEKDIEEDSELLSPPSEAVTP